MYCRMTVSSEPINIQQCDEKVLEIPEKLMLSSDTAMQGVLGKSLLLWQYVNNFDSAGSVIGRDEMLKMMPNISLALHLLNEKCSPSSYWEPYISKFY